jgi:hypothetical protein
MGVAVVDTGLTIIAAWICSWWVGGGSFLEYLIFLFVLGEILHYIFGVNSAVINAFGLRRDECS